MHKSTQKKQENHSKAIKYRMDRKQSLKNESKIFTDKTKA